MNIDIDQRFCCKRENTIPFVLYIHIKAKQFLNDTFLWTLLDFSLFIFETEKKWLIISNTIILGKIQFLYIFP